MDIKERIDALTEAEAKAALLWYAEEFPFWHSCKNCIVESRCRVAGKKVVEKCMKNMLELALKEARK